ncbi:glycerol-3-phosphate 1-O-acyltransferase PlsY [uncultured Fibrobacter sp.]|uniref:glycerol-3-phosphate 1-O-acyltransferase PlsY n=1 Tax=uncultured Fibrobacter sp. TaxID=261512 RepID=UPI002608ACED|nr:glycerol-3-phosphate 1-O-acyltransferase PlsY [uncultured Fibrobacter sp.]
MRILNSLLSLPIAYLLGSIPSAIWIAKLAKGRTFDIRDYGSKNAGLTNTFRVLGFKPALPVVFMDLLKGFFGPWIAIQMCEAQVAAGGADYSHWVPLVAGILVILGHSFTCFAGFRGGKGVLAALGVFLALCPITALSCLGVWIVLTFATKYVSVGSIGACVALALISTLGYFELPFPPENINEGLWITCLLVAVFVIVKHKANIKRLMNGTENGFGSKRKTPKE